MTVLIRILVLFVLLLGAAPVLRAQSNDSLYFIRYAGIGEYFFSRFDLATGMVTDIEPVPLSAISSAGSSCIDPVRGRYHLSTGYSIITFNPDDAVAPVTTPLPVPSGANFFSIEYDPCDSVFMGVVSQPGVEITFVRFDPGPGEFVTMTSLPTNIAFCAGCQAMFDPSTRLYMVRYSHGFFGIDVDNGTIVYETPINNLPDFTPMHHLAYDCEQQLILGTAVGLGAKGEVGKFLLELDPATGDVTALSGTPTQSGLSKPMLGGSCIDQGTGIFYWAGAGGVIIGATGDGDMTYDQLASSGELYLIEHFSACSCSGATGISGTNVRPSPKLFPNPAQDHIRIEVTMAGGTFTIEDGTGRIVRMVTSTAGSTEINLAGCAPGVYSLRTDEQRVIRFVIQP